VLFTDCRFDRRCIHDGNDEVAVSFDELEMLLTRIVFIVRPSEVPVFNLTCSEKKLTTWGTVLNEGKRINYEYPFEGCSIFKWPQLFVYNFLLLFSWALVPERKSDHELGEALLDALHLPVDSSPHH
jgi:hypothetical protein